MKKTYIITLSYILATQPVSVFLQEPSINIAQTDPIVITQAQHCFTQTNRQLPTFLNFSNVTPTCNFRDIFTDHDSITSSIDQSITLPVNCMLFFTLVSNDAWRDSFLKNYGTFTITNISQEAHCWIGNATNNTWTYYFITEGKQNTFPAIICPYSSNIILLPATESYRSNNPRITLSFAIDHTELEEYYNDPGHHQQSKKRKNTANHYPCNNNHKHPRNNSLKGFTSYDLTDTQLDLETESNYHKSNYDHAIYSLLHNTIHTIHNNAAHSHGLKAFIAQLYESTAAFICSLQAHK